MRAFDTNAVLRFLVNDDDKQSPLVYKILLDAQKRDERIFIPQSVILETIWVLGSYYKYTRNEILTALDNLIAMPTLEIEAQERIAALCRTALDSTIELDDLLIGLTAHDYGCETTLTFDRHAAKSGLFTLIG